MRHFPWAFTLVLTLLPRPASPANFKTAKDLYRSISACYAEGGPRRCSTQESADYFEAAGYVLGVHDLLQQSPQCACWPQEGVTVGQLLDIVLKFLRDHPDALHRNGADIVGSALTTAWPCDSK
jgi:hypothetical protein